ncbi:MAG: hypothetical protein M3441_10480 [Chloroflexota bacterium]|nr:hypothetical protein [Chloroflexota bacterium]
MTRDLRWRIISLQVLMIVVLGFGAGAMFYANNFTNSQIRGQIEPQQIFFPKDVEPTIEEINAKFPDLQPYIADLRNNQGQQVLTGNQAHVFAEAYLGVHLREIDNGKPYSVLSSEARAEKDPALKAEKDAKVQTAFRGETLRSILNQAWAFSVMGDIAMYVAIGLLVATLLVAASLVFELFVAPKREVQAVRTGSLATNRA